MIVSNLPPFSINKTCAVTGHRILPKDFDRIKLKIYLGQIAENGYEIFLVGMAKGFDLECFSVLTELKNEGKKVKICAVIPCSDQTSNYSEEEKNLYSDCLSNADYIAAEKKPYFKNCMLIRDDYLVDNSSLLLAYHDGRREGGTYYTIKKAGKKGLKIIYY